jgi:hypothetical protein
LPELKKYCAEKNLNFKILLILDNASAHVLDDVSLFEIVKITYMLPRPPPLMQPTDQGMISVLKSYYLYCIFKKLIMENDANNELTVHKFWQASDILECV